MRAAAFPVYYGWLVLAASAVSEMLIIGATSYAAGLFVLPLQAEYHLSRADANSAILILFLGSAIIAPIIGRILDRYPIRLVISTGTVVFALAFTAIAVTKSLWVMAAMLALPAAIGFMVLGPLTTTTLATRWFYRRRGLALGIAAVATSGGGFVVVPLLSEAIQHFGWRTALIYEAAAIAGIALLMAVFVLRDNPFDMGLAGDPENYGRPPAILPSTKIGGFRAGRDILASRAFWIPSLTLAAISGTCQATVITVVPYGVGLGFSSSSAAFLVSAFAIAAALTKVLAGILTDNIEKRFLLVAAAMFMTLSWLGLSFSAAYWMLFTSACLAGIALGCALPTVAGLIAAHFGVEKFGGAMGLTYVFILSFAVIAVRFIGFMYDSYGGYHLAFVIFALILAFLFVSTVTFVMRDGRTS